MNCTKCSHPLQEGELFCKQCGYQFAVAEQKEKIAAAKGKTKGVLAAHLHSVIFLIVAICFTVMFVTKIGSMFTGNPAAIVSGIFDFIFMLIAVIGLWKSYSVKSADDVHKAALKKASIFDAYTRVMYTISIVMASIATVIIAVALFFGAEFLAEMLGSEELTSGGAITALVFLLVMALAITFISIYRSIYANRRLFFLGLDRTATTGEYVINRAPVVGSWFIGICGVLSAIPTLTLSIAGPALITGLVDSMAPDLAEIINPMVESMFSGMLVTSISGVITGAYYILSAIWMTKVHKAEVAAQVEIATETARLAEVEEATRDAVLQYDMEKRRIEEEKARALEEERKAAELAAQKKANAMQEQQQMMMQMMMQQMMQQQGFANMMNNNATPQVTPTIEETPVEETPVVETPVEEAPVVETPVEEAPVVETTVEEAPVNETPVEEAPAVETPVEEAPAIETPAEETPAVETPVEEAPVVETPVEEAPATDAE